MKEIKSPTFMPQKSNERERELICCWLLPFSLSSSIFALVAIDDELNVIFFAMMMMISWNTKFYILVCRFDFDWLLFMLVEEKKSEEETRKREARVMATRRLSSFHSTRQSLGGVLSNRQRPRQWVKKHNSEALRDLKCFCSRLLLSRRFFWFKSLLKGATTSTSTSSTCFSSFIILVIIFKFKCFSCFRFHRAQQQQQPPSLTFAVWLAHKKIIWRNCFFLLLCRVALSLLFFFSRR